MKFTGFSMDFVPSRIVRKEIDGSARDRLKAQLLREWVKYAP